MSHKIEESKPLSKNSRSDLVISSSGNKSIKAFREYLKTGNEKAHIELTKVVHESTTKKISELTE